jgi:hypothetical protein
LALQFSGVEGRLQPVRHLCISCGPDLIDFGLNPIPTHLGWGEIAGPTFVLYDEGVAGSGNLYYINTISKNPTIDKRDLSS